MNAASQIYEFAGCVYAGIILGAVYAVFDVIRRLCGGRKAITVLTDVLYVIICTLFSAYAIYVLAYGRVAFYHYIGIICGIFLYVKSVHSLCLGLFGER